MRKKLRRPRRVAVAGAAVLALVAGCGGAGKDNEPVQPANLAEGEPGAAEDTEITVAIPFPDVTMYSMYVIGTELGYYEEEGLSVKVITADNVSAAVSSGSADIGIDSAGAVVEAVRGGVEVAPLAGHFCRQTFDFAVQPDVTSVEDLDGTDVVLAGTSGDPQEFQRALVLKEEGWDLDTVDVQVVYPGPDSATWREFFLNDRVSLMPFYGDDRPALEEYGANMIIQTFRPWANDWHLANREWLAQNPNSAVRFLRATMKAVDFLTAPGLGETPENKDRIIEIYEKNDFDVADLKGQDSPWMFDAELACSNLYLDEKAWNTTIETQGLQPLAFGDYVDLSYLEKAQELMNRDNQLPSDELTYP